MKVEDVVENSDYVTTGLYHRNKFDGDVFYTKPTTGGRKPASTALFIHNYLNEISKKKFGVPIRDGFFSSTLKDTLYGPELYDVMLNPSTTRIFVNTHIPDFTDKYKFSPKSISFILAMESNNIFGELYPKYLSITTKIKDYVREIPTVDKLKALISEDAEEILDIELREKYKAEMNKVLDDMIGKCDEYMDNVLEVSVSDIEKYSKYNPEYMLYCTGKIKLVRNLS